MWPGGWMTRSCGKPHAGRTAVSGSVPFGQGAGRKARAHTHCHWKRRLNQSFKDGANGASLGLYST